MAEVKLFGKSESHCSRRVELALKLKGVEYEYFEEDFSNKSPLLLQYNPVYKQVPVLVHKGKPIPDSSVILEYIDEIWKDNPILPQDPYERARARFWGKFIEEKCMVALLKALWSPRKGREDATREVLGHLKTLENELNDKKFFGGENIGFVDIIANFLTFWLRDFQEATGFLILTEERFPKLWKWAKEYVNFCVVKEDYPSKDILVTYFKARFETCK